MLYTIEMGKIYAHQKIWKCPKCHQTFYSEKLKTQVATGSNVSYAVLVVIGKALFCRYLSITEVQKELIEKYNIKLSKSEISYLGRRFIIYLAIVHKQSQSKIKELLNLQGGYILHIDGTIEGDSPHLMTALDGIAEIVLGNIKLRSENKEDIIPFLKNIKASYGNPLATVSDLSRTILGALEEVFPKTFIFICHFHFLRVIGKDLFEKEYSELRQAIQKKKIRINLKNQAHYLGEKINQNPELKNKLTNNFKPGNKKHFTDHDELLTYSLIMWIQDANEDLNGYGYPFDRKYLNIYQRLEKVKMIIINCQNNNKSGRTLNKLLKTINTLLEDENIQISVTTLLEKKETFEKLRSALRIADPNNCQGLNDNGSSSEMKTIKKAVTKFKKSKRLNALAKQDKSYQKIINQLNKYDAKLFADPITIKMSKGEKIIYPQRTNNIMEQFFRHLKHGYRKQNGNRNLTKTLKSMLQDTPLINNINNSKYLKIILNGKDTLAKRFAEVDINLVHLESKQQKEDPHHIKPVLKKLIRKKEFKNILLFMAQKKMAA